MASIANDTKPLRNLPVEVYSRVIPFLKREDFLSFFRALSNDRSAQSTLLQIVRQRLEFICQAWERSIAIDGNNNNDEEVLRRLEQQRPTVEHAIQCLRDFINSEETEPIQQFEASLWTASCFSSSLPAPLSIQEFPIWCGRIQVLVWIPRGAFHGMQRVMMEANAMILSPNWDPLHYPAWSSLGNNDENTVPLVADSYNFIPTTPMGRLVGIQANDREVLQQIAGHLANQNTVAIPAPNQAFARQRKLQAVRIVSRSQAKQRIKKLPARLPYRFYIDEYGDGVDLICCWELRDLFQEATLTTPHQLMPFWKQIVQNKEKMEDE